MADMDNVRFEMKRPFMWNSAPVWANYWFINAVGNAFWCEEQPEIVIDRGCEVGFDASHGNLAEAPLFDFKGKWQESLLANPYPKSERLT